MPTEEEIQRAAREHAEGNFARPETVRIIMDDLEPQPIEFIFVGEEPSVFAWRAWCRMSRQVPSGSHTDAQQYSFAIRNGLRLATWYPRSAYVNDGEMPAFSFAPEFSERDGRD